MMDANNSLAEHWVGIQYDHWLDLAYFPDLIEKNSCTPSIPCVITSEKPPLKVLAANAIALMAGIEINMNLASAEALAPQLEIAQASTEKELQSLQEISEFWHNISPYVYVVQPNTILIEVSHCLNLWNGKDALISKIKKQLSDASHTSMTRLAWGFSPLSIRASLESHALYSPACPQQTAQKTQKPEKFISATHEYILSLPLSQLPYDAKPVIPDTKKQKNRIEDKALQKFKHQAKNMGLHTIAQLFEIKKNELSMSFSPEVIQYLERFCGDRIDPQHGFSARHYFEKKFILEPPIEDSAILLDLFKKGASELQPHLLHHQLATRQISVTFIDETQKSHKLDIGTRQATANLDVFQTLFELQLARITIERPLQQLLLEIQQLVPVLPSNASLWPEETQIQATHARTQLLDKLQHRLGQESVQILTSHEHHTPEENWRNLEDDHSPHSHSSLNQSQFRRRPRFLFTRPLEIDTHNNAPFFQGPLKLYAGPEKITLISWLHTQTRDYYCATCTKKTHYWIFQTQDKAWYIHGVFS